MSRSGSVATQTFTATLDGDVLIIQSPDGAACVSGPPGAESPTGADMIVFQGER